MGSLNILSLLVEINLQSFKKNKYKHIERYMLIMGTELDLRSKKTHPYDGLLCIIYLGCGIRSIHQWVF